MLGKTRVRVSHKGRSDVPDMTRGPFVATGIVSNYGVAYYILAKIKKDGTPSNAASGANATDICILPEDQPK